MSSYWGLWGLHEALHRSDDGQFYANEYDENEPEHPDGPEGFWHGTPSGDLRGAHYGLHVGTYKAASEALNARIGKPAEGYWDGTRVYGETPVVSPGAGYGLGPPGDPKRVENPYDAHLPNGKATFSDGTPIPMHFKPAILPVRIKGLMANTPHEPYEDDEANDLMTERLNQGRTRHGFYYTNDGEGGYLHPKTGKWLTSISAVVPNGDHLQVLDPNWTGHHTASTDDWGLHTAADDYTWDSYDLPSLWQDYHHWWAGEEGDPEDSKESIQNWSNVESYLHENHGLPDAGFDKTIRTSVGGEDWDRYYEHPATVAMAKLHSLAQGKNFFDDDPLHQTFSDDEVLEGAALGLLKIRRNQRNQIRTENGLYPTASTDGIRYAQVVEADVAEDLHRLAGFKTASHEHVPSGQRGRPDWTGCAHPECRPDLPTTMYHVSHPRNRDSIAQHGLLTSYSEDDEFSDELGMPHGIYMTADEPKTSHDTERWPGDVWAVDTTKLKHLENDFPGGMLFRNAYATKYDVPPEAIRLHRPSAHHTARLAMPSRDAYDDMVMDSKRKTDDIPEQGEFYHGSNHEHQPGDILESVRARGDSDRLDYYEKSVGAPNHADWVWMYNHPAPATKYHKNVYELEPLDEGPWIWNNILRDDGQFRPTENDEDFPRLVSPRARVVRKLTPDEHAAAGQHLNDYYEKLRTDSQRLAMPAPMPEGITFHHHPTNDTVPTEPWAHDPTVLVPQFSAPAVEARHNGKTVGFLEWDPPLHNTTVNGISYGDHPPEVSMIRVEPDYRRHGIGTALFDFARSHQGDLEHSDTRTGLGNKWVEYEQSRNKTAMPQPLPQGVYFRYHPELMWSPGVTAHAPGGRQIGSLEWYDDDHVMVELGTRRPGEIDRIAVHPDHQGQSIATSMFDFAKQHEPRLHHSDQLTEDGRGWSEYEQSRHARLAMAWDQWAPQIQGGCEHGCDHSRMTMGEYSIAHPFGRSALQFTHDTAADGTPELYISGVHTHEKHRRSGVAEALMRRLHDDHPGTRINPGSMTDMGQGLKDGLAERIPGARDVLAGRNGDPPPMTFEPFNTMWSNGIMARHAEDGRPIAHLHWYPDGEIESIRVHPELQGRDIGKHILAHAVTHPETYEAEGGIKPSNHMTDAGRAYAKSLGYNPPDEEITHADNDVNQWGWTAVRDYVPMSVPYTGQNEDEMSKHLEDEWTPPTQKTAATNDGWPVWWRGRHRPGVEFDKRWHPNHPEHVPAPWESSL